MFVDPFAAVIAFHAFLSWVSLYIFGYKFETFILCGRFHEDCILFVGGGDQEPDAPTRPPPLPLLGRASFSKGPV